MYSVWLNYNTKPDDAWEDNVYGWPKHRNIYSVQVCVSGMSLFVYTQTFNR